MNVPRILAACVLLAACSSSPSADDPQGSTPTQDPRKPLGKADASGSCQGESRNYCGGKSAGACWCDEQCTQYGDCCEDRSAVCSGLPLSVASIDDVATFDALAFSGSEGAILGKSVKFLIDNRNSSAPEVHFVNANYPGTDVDPKAKQFHFYFAQATLPNFSENGQSFNDKTYWTQDKSYFAGTLQEYRLGASGERLYGIQFYPQDVIAEQTLLHAVQALVPMIHLDGARLGFVALGPHQTATSVKGELTALGVEALSLDQVLGALNYIPMQVGEAWGYLRIFPQNQEELSALDIPVFEDLPLDLTVVAASITKALQDASSHVNLKSKERNTPNMVLRDAGPSQADLAPFANKPIHLIVNADRFFIEASTDVEVLAKYKERTNKPWQPLTVDANGTTTSYRAMCPSDPGDCLKLAPRFGGKAGNLGFLIHPKVLGITTDAGSRSAAVGYDLAPYGVGVPVQRYFEFVKHGPNTGLRQALTQLIDQEKQGTLSTAERVQLAKSAQQAIYAAQMPQALLDEVTSELAAALPAGTQSVKIRSSANAEDIPGFDGAGLYDSFRADLDEPNTGACAVVVDNDGDLEAQPRSVECAIKAVYASLWNKRAIEERSFARIDHASAGMGLAIVQRYQELGDVASNSVVVTRVLNSGGVYGYTFSSQVGNNVVTNPEPGTSSENVMAAFLPGQPTTFAVTRYATPNAGAPALTQTVMTEAQMAEMLALTQHVENMYCREKPDYYEGSCNSVLYDVDKARALDMELKRFDDGHFLLKQVREFSGK
ncbi:MAG: PEP/pyruvate-binding domain-containing protein [Polyangiaceae bacterium]